MSPVRNFESKDNKKGISNKVKLLRRLFIFLFILSIVYTLIFVAINLIFQNGIRRNLEERLSKSINAQVNIKGFKTDILTAIAFKDVCIKKEKIPFSLDIPQINFKHHPLSLFKNSLKGKIEFKDLFISYKDLKIKENVRIIFSFKPKVFNRILEIEEISLKLDGKPTLRTKGSLQPIFKPKEIFLQTELSSLSILDFYLRNLTLDLNLLKEEFSGRFLMGVLNYKKLNLNNISSKIFSQDKRIHLKNLEANIFEGRIDGEGEISFFPTLNYELNLKFSNLNLREITQRFAPPDWRAKGEISGDLKLRIEGRDLKDLKGNFSSQRPGAINMKAIRRLIAGKVGIDKEILKKNVFPYENLIGEISLLGDEIIVKLDLEGKEAKFNFDIKIDKEILYSFLLR